MSEGETPGVKRTPEAAMEAELDRHLAVVSAARDLLPAVGAAADAIIAAFEAGRRLYSLGNGGSAADAQHLAAELAGRFRRERDPLPAVALTTDPSVMTAIGNDYSFDDAFGRQVRAHVRRGDIVVAFTTSGESENVVRALDEARRLGASTILFAGRDGGRARRLVDHAVIVPGEDTARIQEVHLLFLHLLSERIDAWAAEGERSG